MHSLSTIHKLNRATRPITAPSANPQDFRLENHGSISLLCPLSNAARLWVQAHFLSDAQWFGDSIVVEPRFVEAVVIAIHEDGFWFAP
jgi:hypothetical protein